MKTAALIVLLLSPVLVSSNGLDLDLDDLCGIKCDVNNDDERENYRVRNPVNFHHLCKVIFRSFTSSDRFEMDVSAERLDPAQCAVSVLEADGTIIVRNITSTGYFTRTFKSGKLKLHVQGPACSGLGLTISVSPICTSDQFNCNDGQCVDGSDVCDGVVDCADGSDEDDCFWTVGAIVGISCAAVVSVALLVVALIVCYRRRVVVARHPMLIQPGHRSIGVAGNPSSINGNTVVNPVK